jgi:hypothetical protein
MDAKSDKSWLLGLDRGPAGHDRVFAVGTNARRMASRALSGIFSPHRASKMDIPVRIRRLPRQNTFSSFGPRNTSNAMASFSDIS